MYTTQERVEAYLERELTDNEASLVDEVIEYISDFINAYTNRYWLPVVDEDDYTALTEAVARYFDGNGKKTLFVEDFSGLSQIRILDSQGDEYQKFILATDWILTPANKSIKQTITLRNYHFPVGRSNVEVTAVWGAGAVPTAVVTVATALVGKYFIKASATNSKFTSESIEGYSYTLRSGQVSDQEIMSLLSTLDMYKRVLL